MKLIAFTLTQNDHEVFDYSPNQVREAIPQIFLNGYNRILAKWNKKMYILEMIDDRTLTDGIRVQSPDLITYTKTEIQYHPLQTKL